MLACCGEMVERGEGQAFGSGEVNSVSMGDGGELIVCQLTGNTMSGHAVVGAA